MNSDLVRLYKQLISRPVLFRKEPGNFWSGAWATTTLPALRPWHAQTPIRAITTRSYAMWDKTTGKMLYRPVSDPMSAAV